MAIATALYVDGCNLYYGRIRNTRFKWIDVVRLFEILLRDQDPSSKLVHVHCFSRAKCRRRIQESPRCDSHERGRRTAIKHLSQK